MSEKVIDWLFSDDMLASGASLRSPSLLWGLQLDDAGDRFQLCRARLSLSHSQKTQLERGGMLFLPLHIFVSQ